MWEKVLIMKKTYLVVILYFCILPQIFADSDKKADCPSGMVWVHVDDPGLADHENSSFAGYVSKYEVTNAQYCEFLNAALASGDIKKADDNIVYGAEGSNEGADFPCKIYFKTYPATPYSQIVYEDDKFKVRCRDGIDMSNHPVVEVSWYGATAFCNYYSCKLPNEWQWAAIADFDGSYVFGCGKTIDEKKARYYDVGIADTLGLKKYPFTAPVGHYGEYGYGLCDISGNVCEWTSTEVGDYRVIRGGGWRSYSYYNMIVMRDAYDASSTSLSVGFRPCR